MIGVPLPNPRLQRTRFALLRSPEEQSVRRQPARAVPPGI